MSADKSMMLQEEHRAATHTPGPWVPEGPLDNIHIVRAHQPHMRVAFLTSDGPTRANAYLIAAAPDLLEEVRAVLHDLRDQCNCAPSSGCTIAIRRQKLAALVARAEGVTENP